MITTYKMAMAITLSVCSIQAVELHVSPNGLDSNKGDKAKPFKTISAAAQIAMPGDVITVHEGIYREHVNPPRGGMSDDKRIVYQAASGEKVVITGSELVTGWEKVKYDTWKVTLPNRFFGDYNPYTDVIGGEWYQTPDDGFDRHTGAVYLNGHWLTETPNLERVLAEPDENPLWFAQVTAETTTLWAQFKDINPNQEQVEINVRQSIFYPDQSGLDYITVRGFVMRQAAAPWGGALSEQVALLGTHWSKGWIIENNDISYSMNAGITLGLCDYRQFGVTIPTPNAMGYTQFVKDVSKKGWTKDEIGSHVVRNNHISHCEKNGIHASLGGPFSTLEGNEIHAIATMGWVHGPDIGGIKLLGGIDAVIRNNCVYDIRGRGIWLDWLGQGAIVRDNLIFDTHASALYLEVNHGPILVANNVLASNQALCNRSRGLAFVNNLFAGRCFLGNTGRKTPYLKPHSSEVAGEHENYNGDDQFFNNIFAMPTGAGKPVLSAEFRPAGRPTGRLAAYNDPDMPVKMDGNLYTNGALPNECDQDPTVLKNETVRGKILRKKDGFYLEWTFSPVWIEGKTRKLITSTMLGRAKVPDMKYENSDGTPYRIDADYFGKKRNSDHPAAGPFAAQADKKIQLKLWARK